MDVFGVAMTTRSDEFTPEFIMQGKVEYIKQVYKLLNLSSRYRRLRHVISFKKREWISFTQPGEDCLIKCYSLWEQREKNHTTLVRKCLDIIEQNQSTCSVHGFGKDSFFNFILLGKYGYNLKVDDELTKSTFYEMFKDKQEADTERFVFMSKFDDILLSELNRRREMEKYHPQYESVHNEVNSQLIERNVLQLAVSRLARNLQFNRGTYNFDGQNIPVWRSENKQKVALFKSFLKNYADLVLQQFTILQKDIETKAYRSSCKNQAIISGAVNPSDLSFEVD